MKCIYIYSQNFEDENICSYISGAVKITQQTNICSKSTKETMEKGGKYV